MVTSATDASATELSADQLMAALRSSSGAVKWDLRDAARKESWLLLTEQALKRDTDVWLALTHGTPTVEGALKRDPALAATRAASAVHDGLEAYAAANAKGFEILLARVDWSKRAELAARVRRICRLVRPLGRC